MKQIRTIDQLKKIIPKIQGVEVALLYGSFGRGEGNPNSDIDIQILINQKFETQNLKNLLENEFGNEIQFINFVDLRNKLVVYFKHQPKIEFAICKKIEDVNRNYIGSEIKDISKSILFANDNWKIKINYYLQDLVDKTLATKSPHIKEKNISNLIEKFVYEFESCSTMHRRSDAFQFYFFYNIALHVAIQLNHLSKGETKYNFLPKNFVANTLCTEDQKQFYDLRATLYLPEANKQKRQLLDFFYKSIESIVSKDKREELSKFLEWIYERDFFWNFRDISTYNSRIKSGIIYRTATLTFFQNEKIFDDLLQKTHINTVIDLRADREIEEHSYTEETKNKFTYIKAQFDPWNQPEWFKEKHHYGTNEEIAYRFFAIGCNDKIKTAFEAIIHEDNATCIHCFAGKDRTGILISLLHILVDTPLEVVFADFLASEVDVKPYRLEMVLNVVNEKGGIVPYLIDCGLKQIQIEKLKKKLLNEN